jgi:hypothetical protein
LAGLLVGHQSMISAICKWTAEIPSPASLRSAPSPAVRERG